MLRRAVDRALLPPDERHLARDLDDRAARLPHAQRRFPRQEVGAASVDGHDPVVIVLGRVERGAVPHDSCGIHKHIECAALREEAGDAFGVRDVEDAAFHFESGLAERANRLSDPRFVSRRYRDLRARPGQRRGGGESDPARAAGDESLAAVQPEGRGFGNPGHPPCLGEAAAP